MSNSILFTCTALRGSNKTGLIKPDAHGYYEVVLGALNAFNSHGDYYPFEPVRKLFESSSNFMRMIQRGALRGELDHPVPEPGMSGADFGRRIMYIDPRRISHHIAEVRLDFDGARDDNGRPVILVIGKVKPAGELGHVLEAGFKNPHENVAFSIRSMSVNNRMGNGKLERNIRNIITWDYVTEPGIPQADKYYSPSLESLRAERPISRSDLESVRNSVNQDDSGVSMESAVFNIDELFTSMGWQSPGRSKALGW